MVADEVIETTETVDTTPESFVEQTTTETPAVEKSSTEKLEEVVAKVQGKKDDTEVVEPTAEEKAAAAAAEAAKAYKPNFKFNVSKFDPATKTYTKEEKELPKWAQEAIKDADTEKEAREIWEKALGIEEVKASRASIKQERDFFAQQTDSLNQGINNLRTMYQKGDLDGFFQRLNIPQERILQYALSKVEYSQMTPEQKAIVDAKALAERHAYTLEEQNRSMSHTVQAQITELKRVALDSTLARADFHQVASEYDTRVGKPGAFRQQVIDMGELTWNRSQGKTDLTPEQAAIAVMNMMGLKIGTAPAQTMTVVTDNNVNPGNANQPQKKPAVIPNIRGAGSTSPLQKPNPRSIADLQKLSKEKFG